jgi:hypothetical protein
MSCQPLIETPVMPSGGVLQTVWKMFMRVATDLCDKHGQDQQNSCRSMG